MRKEYKPKVEGLSVQNEPSEDFILTCNFRQYPDMDKVYNKFSELFEVDRNRFILGSGLDNITKTVLLSLKPKNLMWSKPTWGMLDVYCEALDITPINKEFRYENSEIIECYSMGDFDGVDCVYSNCGTTNLFDYISNLDFFINSKESIFLLDTTYMGFQSVKSLFKKYKDFKNVIILGSFDKILGCGLRCGYVIFPESMTYKMNLNREQYINSGAAEAILGYSYSCTDNSYYIKLLDTKYIILNRNFVTYREEDTKYPRTNHKKFTIGNQNFIRFGMPNNDIEFEKLSNSLISKK